MLKMFQHVGESLCGETYFVPHRNMVFYTHAQWQNLDLWIAQGLNYVEHNVDAVRYLWCKQAQ